MKALILLSGGLDSTVVLAMAIQRNLTCYALSFDYGQRHKTELKAAQAIAQYYHVPHRLTSIVCSAFIHSSLVSPLPIPKYDSFEEVSQTTSTSTYVPARNTLFLAYALGHAEILEADEIHCGPNVHDYNCYPDCREEYFSAFQAVANLATKQGMDGKGPRLCTPLIHMTKKEIVRKGKELNAPLDITHSCYDPSPRGKACDNCLACFWRNEAFSH